MVTILGLIAGKNLAEILIAAAILAVMIKLFVKLIRWAWKECDKVDAVTTRFDSDNKKEKKD